MSRLRIIVERVSTLVLWLATIVLGITDIYFIREIFFAVFARFSTREGRVAVMLGNLIVVIAAIVLVGFIVVSTEYHRKHLCKHESWDLFTRTLVVELAVPFIAFWIA